MANRTHLKFYFDFISPYAYLGWTELRRLQDKYQLFIDARPVLFAGLLNAHGTLGPAEVEAKRQFVFLDSLRKAALLDIPLNPPFGHPFNPLLPLRLVLATPDDDRSQLIDELYRATWVMGIEVSARESLSAFLDSLDSPIANLDEIWQRSESDDIKTALRTNTAQAVKRKVFGVPTFLLHDELYWGVDNLPALEAALQGRLLISEEQAAPWRSIRPLAQRKPT